MPLSPITSVTGTAVHVPGSDIDTDRIIPARFMKCVTFEGLGEFLFYDVRRNEDGSDKDHPLNDPRFAGAKILLTGSNFGCGSSREHAPQAIYRRGFRAIVAESFAEIFFGNCTTLGVPCAVAAAEDIARLSAAIEAAPDTVVRFDVVNSRVSWDGDGFPVHIPESARDALAAGRWDPIGELLEGEPEAARTAAALGYV